MANTIIEFTGSDKIIVTEDKATVLALLNGATKFITLTLPPSVSINVNKDLVKTSKVEV